MIHNAVCWIVTEPYFKEASKSAESVKEYLGECERILMTPDNYTGNHFTKIIKLEKRIHAHWYLDEVRYFGELCKLPYDKIIFLDSDMLLIKDCSDLWRLLDKFDIALAHAPTRQTAPTIEVLPSSWVEFCTGIMAIRNNSKIKYLFQEWYEMYRNNVDKFLNNDQVPLRETLWNTELPIKVATLPPEMNCRFGLCGSAIKSVRILHGRYDGDMQDVINMVDTSRGMVTWEFGALNKLKEQRTKDANANSGDTILLPPV